jgi:hypothetical protein
MMSRGVTLAKSITNREKENKGKTFLTLGTNHFDSNTAKNVKQKRKKIKGCHSHERNTGERA